MTTNIVDGQLIFYYPHKLLFENVQHQSAFMCKNIVSKDGEDLSERFSITDDEQPMFKLCLAETAPDIYDVLKPIVYGFEFEAYYPSITGQEMITEIDPLLQTLPGLELNSDYIVFIVQNNQAYNPNTVKVVDSALRSSIEQGVLSNFYTRVTHPELTKLSATMYVGQLQALTQRIVPLRKKTVFP